MNKGFSIYLDLIRFTAACLVYLRHSNSRAVTESVLPASGYGHSSVIIFFVLSGFVIAYVTDTKEKSWVDYATARISRVYSVAVPAVLLTIALDWARRIIYPGFSNSPFDYFAARIGASLLFVNETWFLSIMSFSNVPYWSLCYEVWYYVAFGLITFVPRRIALPLCVGLAVALGPKVLLLAPLWILGVALYRWKRLYSLPASLSWGLAIAGTVGVVLFHYLEVRGFVSGQMKAILGKEFVASLSSSGYFPADYLLGICVFFQFAGMRTVARQLESQLFVIETPIRYLASFTFTLYLLHQPLFLFWASVIRGDPSGYAYWTLTTLGVGASVLAVGHMTERKRYILSQWVSAKLRRLGSSPALSREST